VSTSKRISDGGASTLANLLALAVAVALPLSLDNQYYLQILANIGINVILVLGLNVITGIAGQLSLCQASFFGIGAYACALLVMRAGLSFWLALPAVTVVTGLVGLIVGVPALRLRGHYLVMLTLGLAVLTVQVLTNWASLTRGPAGLIGIPWPAPLHFGFFDLSVATRGRYCAMILLIALGVVVATQRLLASRLGVSLLALREDERAAELMGIDTRLCKVIAFAISAAIGGLAGGLYAHFAKILAPDEFGIMESVNILMMLIIGGSGTVWGPVAGATLLTILPEGLRVFPETRLIVYGALLIVVILYCPNGLIAALQRLRRSRTGGMAVIPAAPPSPAPALRPVPPAKDDLLVVRGLEKRFGGLAAISGVDFTVHAGEIVGLIGPNGSGKTTMLNLISGALRPSAGEIRFNGTPISGLRPSEISAQGVSRTFQKIRLFRDLSVTDNVVAALAPVRVPSVAPSLWTGRVLGWDPNRQVHAIRLLEEVGLAPRADDLSRALSYGEQRMLEIARALAAQPRLLLLDEPAAGLSGADIRPLRGVIRRLHAAGIAVLLVEHHMRFLMSIVTRVIVLNFGKVIFDGPPAEARHHSAVVGAYLGTRRDVR